MQTNALGKPIRVQMVNANAVNMMNALIHRNVLMENAKTVSNCPSYDPVYELFFTHRLDVTAIYFYFR